MAVVVVDVVAVVVAVVVVDVVVDVVLVALTRRQAVRWKAPPHRTC